MARDSLQTVSGTVTQAAEVTVKRKRRSTKHYYEISVQPDTAGADVRKLRIYYSTPQQLVGNLIDENVTAPVDSSDHDLVYEISAAGTPVISYDTTKQRLQAEATSSAQSSSGAGTWVLAILMTLVGAAGGWSNRKLRPTPKATPATDGTIRYSQAPPAPLRALAQCQWQQARSVQGLRHRPRPGGGWRLLPITTY